MQIFSNTVSTTSTPTLILSNPIPDGNLVLYINLENGLCLFYVELTVSQGMIYPQIAGNYVSMDGNNMSAQFDDGSNLYVNYIHNNPSSNGFYISSDNPQSNLLVNGWVTPEDFSGTLTAHNMYNSSGLVNNSLIWSGSASTDGSGDFSADISSAGFSTVTSVNATAMNGSGVATAAPLASLTSVSNTTVTGNVINAGESGGVFVGSGITVYVTVHGY